MGFVVSTGGYTSSGYKDYRVAQHTNDYLAWASGSTCGWDALPKKYPNVVYGVVKSW
ncbi:MAG: hypothetical protein ACI4CS_08555 [Candidatus Weimeria sp.]